MLPPLSLYVHLPYCVRKCPYCDFNSHTAGDDPPLDRYTDAVIADLRQESACDELADRSIETVFIGGGTPSLFPASAISRILQVVDDEFGFGPDVEITMEANPGTLEFDDPAAYRAAGVNRLSIGGQSFSADALQRLGRIHGPEDIYSALRAARAGGFANVNVDLMFALPGQDLATAREDVDAAIALEVEHISYYQLTLEPNTVFHARPPQDLPDADLAWEIQEQGVALLERAGYTQYEVSAFARDGRHCRHNLNYWTFGDYLAVGAGAHAKLSHRDGSVIRSVRTGHPTSYMLAAESGDAAIETMPGSGDLVFEFMLNILRLQDGFSESLFQERTGLPISHVETALLAAQNDGLMRREPGGDWLPSELGKRFLNDLQARFLPPIRPVD